MSEPEWHRDNRAVWEERAAIHLGPRGYDLAPLRRGLGQLHPIEAAELPPLDGRRVLHLQCHIGSDSLALAQRGAEVVGLDFSAAAIAAARGLAVGLGLEGRTSFIEADVYDAATAVPAPHGFDLVYVTWGALCWLYDIGRWAGLVAGLLRPGGTLYLADAHPAAYVFDDAAPGQDGMPGFFAPYFSAGPVVTEETRDYADPDTPLKHSRIHTWIHPLGEVVTALAEAGLALDWLHEHDAIPWRMFQLLVQGEDRLWRWPEKPWLPLGFSLSATRT